MNDSIVIVLPEKYRLKIYVKISIITIVFYNVGGITFILKERYCV